MIHAARFVLAFGFACVAATGADGSGKSAIAPFADASDRAAFRSWFVLLADLQFEQPADEVTDCAALVRFACCCGAVTFFFSTFFSAAARGGGVAG